MPLVIDADREGLLDSPRKVTWPFTKPIPLLAEDVLELQKSAAMAAAHIIAVGPHGGKIVGYDSQHKPIYATANEAQPTAPAQLTSFLSAFDAPGVHATARPSPGGGPNVFTVDVRPTTAGNDAAVLAAVQKAQASSVPGVAVSNRTIGLPGGGVRMGVRVSPVPAAAAEVQKIPSNVPEGYTPVDPSTLPPEVNPNLADNGYMGATIPGGVVVGRLRFNASQYIVKAPDGSRSVVGKSTLDHLDGTGKLTRATGNPFYRNLPPTALVLKPPAGLSKSLASGLDDVQVGYYGTPRSMLKKLAQNGVASLVVGGTVRDAVDGVQVKDVDVTTTTSFSANLKAVSDAGFHSTNVMSHQNTVRVNGGEGLDIASMRGAGFNNSMYSGDTSMASESNDISEDLTCRDFACNSCYYDHANDVVIDASGRGINDAKANILHPAVEDYNGWLNANGPRNFGRVFKFVARGYTTSPELTQLMAQHFVSQMARPNGLAQAKKALSSAAEKSHDTAYKTEQREKMRKWIKKSFGKYPDVAAQMNEVVKAYK